MVNSIKDIKLISQNDLGIDVKLLKFYKFIDCQMNNILANIDHTRQSFSSKTTSDHKANFGQYFTPASIAIFMASLFNLDDKKCHKILDAGAGIGSLTSALIQKIKDTNSNSLIEVTAIELDTKLITTLRHNLDQFNVNKVQVINQDFIDFASKSISDKSTLFNFIVLNPPYKKINSTSPERLHLRDIGIETVNLYTAFVALSLELLVDQGQLVVIMPRSFCNGTYFKPFRKFLLERVSIKTIHIFESRQSIFQDESILQENIIVHLEKSIIQNNDVCISHSSNSDFNDLTIQTYPFSKIVHDNDNDQFIHIPTALTKDNQLKKRFTTSLVDLGIQVSTGPIVDFRVKEELCIELPEHEHVPLLYPSHFSGISNLIWINPKHKKPNALIINENTKKMTYTAGNYCVVRRFSPKEQKHRIIAHFLNGQHLSTYSKFAFENHLNVFHIKKEGLELEVALGLTIYLNSQIVDQYFRQFSGHTQINVGDLKKLPYPTLKQIKSLGKWAKNNSDLHQNQLDKKVMELSS